MDVLSASAGDDKIAWYENTDGQGNFAPQQIITSNASQPHSVYAADLDGDGDMDVLSASYYYLDDKISWYENTDGQGTFGPEQIITTNINLPTTVYAADIDGDGDMDVLSASESDSMISWYENTNGLGTFGSQHIISNTQGAHSVYATDIDTDGDMDVLSFSVYGNSITWYENTDGHGGFSFHHIRYEEGVYAVFASDIDNDGDMDVVSVSFTNDGITWHENIDGLGTFGLHHLITTTAKGINDVVAADIDGDGDKDVIFSSHFDDKVSWRENIDGQGNFGPLQTIASTVSNVRSVFAADIDGDGDIDVLSASKNDDRIAWYENTDGQGAFGPQQIITTNADQAKSVYATDIDGDGDMDVLSASTGDNKIAWYENTDGQGTFGPQQIITTNASQPHSVYAADLDGDGDMDVLSASYYYLDNNISWYENTDGQGTFASRQTITTNVVYAESVFAADVDGDGDMDVLSASNGDDKIAWYENTDGQGTFGSQQIITTNADQAKSVYAADLDNDGDIDVLSASGYDDKIAWYENTDGQGTFGPQQIITTDANHALVVFAADINGDAKIDVLSASSGDDIIAWYENLGTTGNISTYTNTSLDFLVYPTPTKNILHIQSKTRIEKVEIYNKLGQLMLKTTQDKIDISHLTKGLYLVKVEDVNGNYGVKKVLKK